MDTKLIENKKKVFNVPKFKKYFYLILTVITIVSVSIVTVVVNENKFLWVIAIILIYINITMIIRLLVNNFRVVFLWRVLNKSSELQEFDMDSDKPYIGEDYAEIIYDLKEILEGIEKSVKLTKKNKRMNIALVNNLNNKLDKPLESILDNVEALKNNNDKDNVALRVLEEKANNLKKLIDELFEASKVASGDIKIELQEIEIVSLLRQALIEFGDDINKSNIILKINIPKDKIYVNGNGEKLWRVFGILIENSIKHSLDNSRVYIELKVKEDKVIISFKNTSKEELNIKPEGLITIINNNKSDNSSGLNLDIAKNLVEIQNGIFKFDIEADLFKVNLTFPIKLEGKEETNDR